MLQHAYIIPQLHYYTLFRAAGVSLAVTPYAERGLLALVRLPPSIHTLGRIFAMYIVTLIYSYYSYTTVTTVFYKSKQTRYKQKL